MSEEYEQLVQRAQKAAADAKGYYQQSVDALQQANNISVEINNTQLAQLEQAKEAIKQAIINKGQNVDNNVSFIEYAQKINQIESDGIDTSEATEVTSSDVSDGLVFYNADGKQVGTLKDIEEVTVEGNVVTIPAGRVREEKTVAIKNGDVGFDDGIIKVSQGYVPNFQYAITKGNVNVNKNTITITEGYIENDFIELPIDGIDTSDATAGELDISRNETAYVKGKLITGKGPFVYQCVASEVITPSGATSNVGEGYKITSTNENAWKFFNFFDEFVTTLNQNNKSEEISIEFDENRSASSCSLSLAYEWHGDIINHLFFRVYGISEDGNENFLHSLEYSNQQQSTEYQEINLELINSSSYKKYSFKMYIESANDEIPLGDVELHVKHVKLHFPGSSRWSGRPFRSELNSDYWLPYGNVIIDNLRIANAKSPTVGKFYDNYAMSEIFISSDGANTSDATEVTSSDVSEGLVFYNADGKQIGALKDIKSEEIIINKNKVTIPSGRIRKEKTVEIPLGNIKITKNIVTVTEGYVDGSNEKIPSGNIEINNEQNKVVVREGFIESQEIDLPPSACNIVKVIDYRPARETLMEPVEIVVSGGGIIGYPEYDETIDTSVLNGTYRITEETKYRSGLSRVYKQIDGEYILAGFKIPPHEGDQYYEVGNHWFFGKSVNDYWYSSVLFLEAEEIPNGSNTWQNYNYGNGVITTSPIIDTIAGCGELISAVTTTAFNSETKEWYEGETVTVSDYSIAPQSGGVYLLQGNKLIGQCIDREVHIPKEGLARRFKAKNGHFVDTVWGTKMMPYGDISYDCFGYSGTNTAPLAKTRGSYLSSPNTLNSVSHEISVNVFCKPDVLYGNVLVFGTGSYGESLPSGQQILITGDKRISIMIGRFSASTDPVVDLYKWNMLTYTAKIIKIEHISDLDRITEMECKIYHNGALIKSWIEKRNWIMNVYDFTEVVDTVRAFGRMHDTYESFVGMIDEACIWDRILTDEEIAEMAKGVQTFNWDATVTEYVQKQPVIYAPLVNSSQTCNSGQRIYLDYIGSTENLNSSGYFRNGAFCNYKIVDKGNGQTQRQHRRIAIGNYPKMFDPKHLSICADIFFEKPTNYEQLNQKTIYVIQTNSVMGSIIEATIKENNLILTHSEGGSLTNEAPYGEWMSFAVCVDNGISNVYINGELKNGSYGISKTTNIGDVIYLFSNDIKVNARIKNVRIYNRTLSSDEVVELSLK